MALLPAAAQAQVQGSAPAVRPVPGATSTAQLVSVPRCRVLLHDQVTLASQRPGIISKIEIAEGETAADRKILVRLSDEVILANLAVAEKKASSDVSVRFSRKAAEFAQVEYEKSLFANRQLAGAVPDIEVKRLLLAMDRAVLGAEQSDVELEILKLTADQIRAELDTYYVRAPFAGTVTRVMKSPGEAVTLGEPILSMVNLDKVRVEGFVAVQDGWRVQRGMPVTVWLDIPDVELPQELVAIQGTLEYVDTGVEPVTGQVRVWATVPNPQHILRGGLAARMDINLKAPASATAARP